MTTLLLLSGFVLALGAGLAGTLRKLLYPRPENFPPDFDVQLLRRSAAESYQPMSRLFAEEDFVFLSRLQPRLLSRLRQQRRRVMREYLRELRAEFERIYAFCRALALKSGAPNFAGQITQAAFSFYGLLLILHMRCAFGWFLHVRVDTADLISAFDRLREAAQTALPALEPRAVMAGGPAWPRFD
jgi:hypothetical protein